MVRGFTSSLLLVPEVASCQPPTANLLLPGLPGELAASAHASSRMQYQTMVWQTVLRSRLPSSCSHSPILPTHCIVRDRTAAADQAGRGNLVSCATWQAGTRAHGIAPSVHGLGTLVALYNSNHADNRGSLARPPAYHIHSVSLVASAASWEGRRPGGERRGVGLPTSPPGPNMYSTNLCAFAQQGACQYPTGPKLGAPSLASGLSQSIGRPSLTIGVDQTPALASAGASRMPEQQTAHGTWAFPPYCLQASGARPETSRIHEHLIECLQQNNRHFNYDIYIPMQYLVRGCFINNLIC